MLPVKVLSPRNFIIGLGNQGKHRAPLNFLRNLHAGNVQQGRHHVTDLNHTVHARSGGDPSTVQDKGNVRGGLVRVTFSPQTMVAHHISVIGDKCDHRVFGQSKLP